MKTHGHQLDRLAADLLRGTEKEAAQRHVAECEECRSWVETYRLFADGLADERHATGHPASEQLASYATDRGRLTAPERERIEAHERSCIPCREQIRLTAEAVAQARPSRASRKSAVPIRLAIAASLLLALGLGWALQRSIGDDDRATAEQRTLSNEDLHGTRLVETDGLLITDSTRIESDGDITLRAADGVVFSEGFAVGTGASLRVEIGKSSDDRDSDTA